MDERVEAEFQSELLLLPLDPGRVGRSGLSRVVRRLGSARGGVADGDFERKVCGADGLGIRNYSAESRLPILR